MLVGFAKACRWCVDELREEDGRLKCSSLCIPKKRGFSVSIIEPRDTTDWRAREDGSSLPRALTRGSLFFTARSAFSKAHDLSAAHTACYVTGEGRVDLHCWETPWEHSCSSSCFLEYPPLTVQPRQLHMHTWKNTNRQIRFLLLFKIQLQWKVQGGKKDQIYQYWIYESAFFSDFLLSLRKGREKQSSQNRTALPSIWLHWGAFGKRWINMIPQQHSPLKPLLCGNVQYVLTGPIKVTDWQRGW